ncbi:MAG: helix-turn-helix domain-containing protein [Propionibacteriales bacterium]|nr:helix-turn-helix domain-containing protein [Propionibacteriales bacterium]
MGDVALHTPDAPGYPVRSVGKALEILLMLRDRETIGIAEASRELGIARSTAHRLLSMLEHYRFAQRDTKSRGYRSGPALVSLGLAAVVRMDIRRLARPHMERLAHEIEETVTLMCLEGADVRFLDSVESPRPVRVAGRTGLLRPAHCTSAGKAILADLPSEQLEKLYPDEPLRTLTERSIGSRRRLLTVLEEVRRAGYATNLGESDAGLVGIGVAIPNLAGSPSAGIGIAAPESRLAPEQIREIADAALRTANAIANTFE